MQNVKRKVFTGAMALLLAASVSAGASSKAFAAQKDEKNLPEKYIQGYLVKAGKKTPVYSDTSKSKTTPYSAQRGEYAEAYPQLSANPFEPAPQRGSTTTESANIGNVIYFDGKIPENTGIDTGGKELKNYLEKKSDGTVEYGGYDPETLKLYPAPADTQQNYQYLKIAFDGKSKLKRETQFELVKSSVVDKSADYNFKEDIMSGVQKWDIVNVAFTTGYKFSVQEGVPGVAQATEEISASLTLGYQHNVVVTDQKTVSESFTAKAVNNPDYQYNDYRGAAYQLSSTYTIVPGDGLKEVLAGAPALGGLANPKYKYNDKEMYFPLTPGSHL